MDKYVRMVNSTIRTKVARRVEKWRLQQSESTWAKLIFSEGSVRNNIRHGIRTIGGSEAGSATAF
jgi:hypothetical protein